MELTDFVKKIGEAIGKDDIAKIADEMKGYFRDDFPMTTGVDFLSQLVSRNMITTADTSLLEEILYVLGIKELIDVLKRFKIQRRLHENDVHESKEILIPVTLLFKSTNPDEPLLRGLMNYLSELLTLPLKHIFFKLDASDEETSSVKHVKVMMKQAYSEGLQDSLTNDSVKKGLSYFGVTGIEIGTTQRNTFQIEESMIPAKMYEEVKTKLDGIQKKLSHFTEGFGGVLEKMQADPKRMQRMLKSSGMSTTLWKNFGRMSNDENDEKPLEFPDMMQDELRIACLYSKARFGRIYLYHSALPERSLLTKT